MNITNCNIYYTHDNGGRPFKVIVDSINNKIDVFKYSNILNDDIYDINVYSGTYNQIFIGKSTQNRMTLFSGGIGKSFDGNSILCLLDNNKYLYIGENITTFDLIGSDQNKIIKYISDVGNNDVPYPYAIDSENNIYFLLESIVLKPNKNNMLYMDKSFNNNDNPYAGLYDLIKMTNNDNQISSFSNIEKFYIGREVYNLNYCPNPDNEYDRLENDFNAQLSYKTKNSDKTELTKDKYIALINSYGKHMGLEQIKNLNIIVPRTF